MTVLEDIMLEESSKKHYYACISSKMWGSLFMSGGIAGIPWGVINRAMSATVSSTLKEAVIRWIKHNNFIKHVHIDGNTITVDSSWWESEKNTEVVVLDCPEKEVSSGIISDKVVYSPRKQHGGIIMGGGDIRGKGYQKEFAKISGIKSSNMTIESAIKKAGLKIKTGDTGIDITAPINAVKKFNGWESSDMYTEDELDELLQEAYSNGYNSGIDDTLDYMDENYDMEEFFEEETSFDLESDYESLQEMDQEYKNQYKREVSNKESLLNRKLRQDEKRIIAKKAAARDLAEKTEKKAPSRDKILNYLDSDEYDSKKADKMILANKIARNKANKIRNKYNA